jgi:hypothetical protein
MDWHSTCNKVFNFFKIYIYIFYLKTVMNGQFTWSDQWQSSYTNWANGWNSIVDNQCAYLMSSTSLWNTTNCDSLNDFICKISKGVN